MFPLQQSGGGVPRWSQLLGDLTETQVIPWDGPIIGTPDTGLSRISPGVVGIGTGGAGGITGSLEAGGIDIIDAVAGTASVFTALQPSSSNAGYYFGDDFTVECPTGSGNQMTLLEVLKELSGRMTRIFLRDENGRRPVYGGTEKFQTDPHWKDLILFYEYFHGDSGAGLGASHQTGWSGLVAKLIEQSGE